MKDAIRKIVGKTIHAVVAKDGTENSALSAQVYLVFTDGSAYELYSNVGKICGAGGLDLGGLEEARTYMSGKMKIVLEEVGQDTMPAPGDVTVRVDGPNTSATETPDETKSTLSFGGLKVEYDKIRNQFNFRNAPHLMSYVEEADVEDTVRFMLKHFQPCFPDTRIKRHPKRYEV